MKKSELVDSLAGATGLSKADAGRFLAAFQDVVLGQLSGDGKVQITGFGTFSTRHRKARQGVNPATGSKIQIPAKRVVAFKASSSLSEKL